MSRGGRIHQLVMSTENFAQMDPESMQSEREVAERMGLTIGVVRMLRTDHLDPADWRRSGREILVSDTGRKKMAAALNLDPVASEELQAPPIVADVVVRKIVANPRIVMGLIVGHHDVGLVRVRVRNAALMAPGMLLSKCQYKSETLYQYTGRQPRFRGRI